MKTMSTVKIILFTLLLFPALAYSQGTLRGSVTDSLSGDPLVGANVFIVGTALGDAVDIEGQFRITGIAAGKHIIKITYVGYITRQFEINIEGGQVNDLDIKLVPDVVQGEEVVITAQAQGQVSAINQQRSSNTIINVVSEEKIKELPDANAAESIGRLPGVSLLRSGGEANKVILRGLSDRYTNVTIDGIRIPGTDSTGRGFDLSTISQSSLAGIELFKALTSDKDGDAIAGTINLVRRKAPSKREIKIETKGGYNELINSAKQYDFSLNYGERFFDDFLGIQINGSIENRIRSNERININIDQSRNNQHDYALNNLLLQYTNEIRKRNGIGGIFDINTPDDGSIKLSGVFSSTHRDYLVSSRDYPSGGGTGGTPTYLFRDREQDINTFNSSLTGNNNLFNLEINWGASFAQSVSDYPYDYQIEFLEPSISPRPDGTGGAGMRNSPIDLKSHPEVFITAAYNNFNAATLQNAYYTAQKNLDKERSAFLNISKEYSIGELFSGILKLGGKYKTEYRFNDKTVQFSPYRLGFWQPYERAADGSIQPKNFSGSYFEDFYRRYQNDHTVNNLAFSDFLDSPPQSRGLYDNLYNLYPLLNRDKLRQWYEINKNGVSQSGQNLEYRNDPTARANYYDVTERVASTYIMNTLNIGQNLTFVAGVRVENEDNNYNSTYSVGQLNGFPIPIGLVNDTTASHKETIILPNFHLNFKPNELINIRIAAYKALARPDFNYRLNTSFAWRLAETSANKEQFVGNPNLKTAQAWNFEINTSLYGNEIGLISFSAYYKEIKYQHHILRQISTQGDALFKYFDLQSTPIHSGTFQLTVPYNSPKPTKVWGFEFEHQINFFFLPGLLKNIVLSYNASLVRSETFLVGTTIDTIEYFIDEFPGVPFYRFEDSVIQIKQQLEEQPKFYGNISLGYDISGFSVRLSLFHQAEYNFAFTPTGIADLVVNPFTRLDLALKYKFTDYLSAALTISNLTDIKEGNSTYDRVDNYKVINIEERYGLTADFGIKLEL